MLVQFSVGNYLSFKDEVTLSMVASSLTGYEEDNLIELENNKHKFLKSAVIYGANASGKSNLIASMAFFKGLISESIRAINNSIPYNYFKLSTETQHQPSYFEVIFIYHNIQYRYGFEIDSQKIHSEWLYHKPKTKEVELFYRQNQNFEIHNTFKIAKRLAEDKMIRPNILFLSLLIQYNDETAQKIFDWINTFNILNTISNWGFEKFTYQFIENLQKKEKVLGLLKIADLGIEAIDLIDIEADLENLSPEFRDDLIQNTTNKKARLKTPVTFHPIFNEKGELEGLRQFSMKAEESQGTQKYFALTGPILDTLENGYILVVDELDAKLHPLLTKSIVQLFNSKETNPKNAQLIFATHDTNLLSACTFRRDQIWFTEKDRFGASKLYSLADIN
nr:ATP-binding protein [Microscillaceae bacterium]